MRTAQEWNRSLRMPDLKDLANRLEREVLPEMQRRASARAVQTALTIVGDLAYHTPVDKSTALSNWQVTQGAPAVGTIKAHYPGEKGSTFGSSAAKVLELAKGVLARKRAGVKIYITNNLPYIRPLNDGHSKQAPAGFIERAILLGRRSGAKVTGG
jgi:hypothetical protein